MHPISFIIITYNRPDDMLELAKNISQLERASELIEEVIIVNNASTEDYTPVKKYLKDSGHSFFRYYDAPENLGVAKGRNFALQKATAPLIVMLDDDAILENKDALINIVSEFQNENHDRPRAIVSFKVLYYENRQLQVNALPHKKFNKYKDKPCFETYYYAGGAHAIRREIMEKLNFYPAEFFYGMEEYDLSYRILDSGYSIVYSNKIVMLHKESPKGRKPKKDKIRMMWVNKSKVAYRYLPGKYFYSTAILWSLQYLRETGFDLGGFVKGWKEIFRIPATEKRNPISKKTLNHLHSLEARLWY